MTIESREPDKAFSSAIVVAEGLVDENRILGDSVGLVSLGESDTGKASRGPLVDQYHPHNQLYLVVGFGDRSR